jgi:OOP family OmpA-OmpF porin
LTRRLFLLLFFFGTLVSPGAKDKFQIRYAPGEKFKITEKTDMSKRVNKTYTGYIYREVRGVCEVSGGGAGGDPLYKGKFYVLEEMKKQAKPVAQKIDEVADVSFTIKSNGDYVVGDKQAYPSLRGFPAFPAQPVAQGEKWRAYGWRVVEPKRDGVYTRVKILSEYQYLGRQTHAGVEYDAFKAQYAMRYKRGNDVYGDDRISDISGKHVVQIYFDASRSRPAFMRDMVEETYTYTDGTVEVYKGFILTWFDMVAVLDRTEVVKDIKKQLEDSKIEDVVVEQRDEGVALTLNKIHFLPDQAVVRPDEAGRLEALYQALKRIPKRTILVRGHTAKWGSVETQESLSVERAKTIVDYLVRKGMDPGRFIYEGKGAREPVATNDTEAGRVQNRRVEIIILED